MRKGALALALTAILLVAFSASAEITPLGSQEKLELLDRELAPVYDDIDIAVDYLINSGYGADLEKFQGVIGPAAQSGLAILDLAGNQVCYKDWYRITYTSMWAWVQYVELFSEQADAKARDDSVLSDQLGDELGNAVNTAVYSYEWSKQLREQVDCDVHTTVTPAPSTPEPAKTPTPVRDRHASPEPSVSPEPSESPTTSPS